MTPKDQSASFEILEQRLEYLAMDFSPADGCKEADFKCDFRADDGNECPCQWALKLNPDCLEKIK